MAQILLLETDRPIAKNFKAYFEQSGHQLVVYSDPQKAILAADSKPPDIIIIDLILAARSGIEFLYELRSYPDWQTIPVIVTGRLTQEEKLSFSDAFGQLNVARYLNKTSASLSNLLSVSESLLLHANV